MREWIAALPMYNVTPTLRGHWRTLIDDTLGVLREDGFADPVAQLDTADISLDTLWRRDDLLFSQTCGYPLMRTLPSSIQIVGTPVFDVPGCDGPNYSSVLVVSGAAYAAGATTIERCRGLRAALNDPLSNSGMNVFRHAVAPFAAEGRFFSAVIETGSHVGSLKAIIEGTADVAAIDCVTFAYAQEIAEIARAPLHVIGYTMQTPGLPLIASASVAPDVVAKLRDALGRALNADPARARALRLRGFASLARSDYAALIDLESEAIAKGYPKLA
jgi:ABC-type phosphate/phosphonate transport system substrate-binding protein